jgi:hypothetical protein
MPNRSRKRNLPRDVNQRAHAIGEMATSEAAPEPETGDDGKNPAAVALGQLGGLKGGNARAAKMSKAPASFLAIQTGDGSLSVLIVSPHAAGLCFLCLAVRGRLGQGQDHERFAGHGADVVVQAHHVDAGDLLD